MKKFLLMGAFLFSILAQTAYSQCCGPRCGSCAPCATPCAPPCATPCAPPCDQPCGDCYCKYVRYQPRCYTTKRCVQEQIPCQKRCCRYVNETYQVQRCRWVPEYYLEDRCRKVPEYYNIDCPRTCTRVICEPQVEYIPTYYWKRECNLNY